MRIQKIDKIGDFYFQNNETIFSSNPIEGKESIFTNQLSTPTVQKSKVSETTSQEFEINTPEPDQPKPPEYKTYKVKENDTLTTVAKNVLSQIHKKDPNYKPTQDDIKRIADKIINLNGLTQYKDNYNKKLTTGQVLKLPLKAKTSQQTISDTTYKTYKVKENDTLTTVAKNVLSQIHKKDSNYKPTQDDIKRIANKIINLNKLSDDYKTNFDKKLPTGKEIKLPLKAKTSPQAANNKQQSTIKVSSELEARIKLVDGEYIFTGNLIEGWNEKLYSSKTHEPTKFTFKSKDKNEVLKKVQAFEVMNKMIIKQEYLTNEDIKTLKKYTQTNDLQMQQMVTIVLNNIAVDDSSKITNLVNLLVETKDPVILERLVYQGEIGLGYRDSNKVMSRIKDIVLKDPEFKENCKKYNNVPFTHGDAYNYYKTTIVLNLMEADIIFEKIKNNFKSGNIDISEIINLLQGATKGQRNTFLRDIGDRCNLPFALMMIFAIEQSGIKLSRREKMILLKSAASYRWSECQIECTTNKKDIMKVDLQSIADMFPNPTGEELIVLNRLQENMEDNKDVFVVNPGNTFDKLVRKYVVDNNKIKKMKEYKDWSEGRKLEAAQEYMKDFREEIARQLGIKDPTKLQPGQIIDFRKVKNWPQPAWLNWKINY